MSLLFISLVYLKAKYKICIHDFKESSINPPNIIATRLNYKKHAEESGLGFPKKPVIFLKATSSVIGPEDKIIIPSMAPDEIDYEAELTIRSSFETSSNANKM
ncbi:MAG: fumarylacetoacetate hydrolase family protein [Candidatus Caldatribacteriota bacterium]|nr:fumarylacetoacetate hydrolase family protein [Candidatus Caldatribacteriota bacterium]